MAIRVDKLLRWGNSRVAGLVAGVWFRQRSHGAQWSRAAALRRTWWPCSRQRGTFGYAVIVYRFVARAEDAQYRSGSRNGIVSCAYF